MESIRKQATKLREQVAKQQQAVFKQFASGLGGPDYSVTDEVEFQQHQKLEKLYISTRAGKHFQRDIVRGVEGYIISGSKQIEIGTRLSDDSRKYGAENTCTSGSTLSKAALSYSRAQGEIEKEREDLLKALGTQVAEPLRAMVVGAPLEDARHLAQRCDRVRQEAEAQAIEVSRRQAKVRESNGNPESVSKLEAAEAKLRDLKSNVATLGKEASAAMAAVEAQQQRLTLQRLIAMAEAQRHYHQRVLQILDQLEEEMMSERQRIEASPRSATDNSMPSPPSYTEVNGGLPFQSYDGSIDGTTYFLAAVMVILPLALLKMNQDGLLSLRFYFTAFCLFVHLLLQVVHPYEAESDVELTLLIGDYVVVRKVSNNGWAEGECKGKAGWFPFGYVERRERILATKVAEVF